MSILYHRLQESVTKGSHSISFWINFEFVCFSCQNYRHCLCIFLLLSATTYHFYSSIATIFITLKMMDAGEKESRVYAWARMRNIKLIMTYFIDSVGRRWFAKNSWSMYLFSLYNCKLKRQHEDRVSHCAIIIIVPILAVHDEYIYLIKWTGFRWLLHIHFNVRETEA